MMPTSGSYILSDIAHADRSTLRRLFESEYGISTNLRASCLFLGGNLSWTAQANNENFNSDQFHTRLVKQLEKAVSEKTPPHQPGTRLIREWHGKVYEVTILDEGYRWQGKTYRSLSRIAQAITGAKWSGPRFFGLKKAPE